MIKEMDELLAMDNIELRDINNVMIKNELEKGAQDGTTSFHLCLDSASFVNCTQDSRMHQ